MKNVEKIFYIIIISKNYCGIAKKNNFLMDNQLAYPFQFQINLLIVQNPFEFVPFFFNFQKFVYFKSFSIYKVVNI